MKTNVNYDLNNYEYGVFDKKKGSLSQDCHHFNAFCHYSANRGLQELLPYLDFLQAYAFP